MQLITDGTGTPTATITGGDSNQPISDLLGLTGHPSKLENRKSKVWLNLVGSGSPEGLDALHLKKVASGKLDAVTSGLSGIADAGELTEIAGLSSRP